MNKEHYYKFALEHKEYHCAAYFLDCIIAEYLEGDIERSKDTFNRLFKEAPTAVLLILQDASVFECIRKLANDKIEHMVSQVENIDNGG
jgi:hypothetical protein